MFNSSPLVSLWEMLEAYARLSAFWCESLAEQESALGRELGVRLGEPWRRRLREIIPEVASFSHGLGLAGVGNHVAQLERLLDWPELSTSRMRDELIALHGSIQHQLQERKFFYVKPERVRFYEQPLEDWGPAPAEFPKVCLDIDEAGKCLAFERGTACVFHLMRVAEVGLRRLARQLHVKLQDRKGKVTPIDEAQWQLILAALNKKLDALRNAPKKRKGRAAQLAAYTEIKESLQSFKDAWRNDLSHGRESFSVPRAQEILGHVKALMRRLAEEVS